MRLFTAMVSTLGLATLGLLSSIATAETMLAVPGHRTNCAFVAATGDTWIVNAGGGAATGDASAYIGPGCHAPESHVATDTAPRGSAAVVFETATWTMMIAGFGLVGVGMRGRRRTFA